MFEADKADNVNQKLQVTTEEERKAKIEDLELNNNQLDHPADLIV